MPYSVPTRKHNLYLATGSAMTTATSQKVDSGTIRRGGTIANSRWVSRGVGISRNFLGNVVNSLHHNQYQKPLSSGTFNSQVKGLYIIRRVTTSLAGVANTILQSGAANSRRRSIHSIQSVRGTTLSAWSFASLTYEGNPVYTWTTYKSLDDLGADHAAAPTAAVPGELTYRTGKKLPVNDDYKSKTSF